VTIEVRRATADEVRPLRLGVLRPTAPLEPAAYDLEPETVHIAALDGDAVIGCVSVFPNAYEETTTAWQLRGMAVAPAYQGRGIGKQVLDAATDAVRAEGAPLLWAYGRVSALGFYQLMGWRAVGEEFTYGPAALPHYVILLDLV
jgi:GNAT superfamily N-acetyltransferase